jgi:hypothetical protein
LRSGEATRVEVQAAGVAATDQLAEILNRVYRLGLQPPNLRQALDALRQRELDADMQRVVGDLNRWRRRDAVREAGTVRWRATHHYSTKGVREGIWHYEAGDGIGVARAARSGYWPNGTSVTSMTSGRSSNGSRKRFGPTNACSSSARLAADQTRACETVIALSRTAGESAGSRPRPRPGRRSDPDRFGRLRPRGYK